MSEETVRDKAIRYTGYGLPIEQVARLVARGSKDVEQSRRDNLEAYKASRQVCVDYVIDRIYTLALGGDPDSVVWWLKNQIENPNQYQKNADLLEKFFHQNLLTPSMPLPNLNKAYFKWFEMFGTESSTEDEQNVTTK